MLDGAEGFTGELSLSRVLDGALRFASEEDLAISSSAVSDGSFDLSSARRLFFFDTLSLAILQISILCGNPGIRWVKVGKYRIQINYKYKDVTGRGEESVWKERAGAIGWRPSHVTPESGRYPYTQIRGVTLGLV